MKREEHADIDFRDLNNLSMTIQEGVYDMLEFEKELAAFDKRSLSFFIVLVAKNESFPAIRDFIVELEKLLGNQ